MLFEVVLETQFAGQNMVNRWNYESLSVPAGVTLSFGLASAMGFVLPPGSVTPPPGSILEQLTGIASTTTRFIQASVRAIYDDIDFFSAPFVPPLFGAIGSNGDAPFVALGLRTNRVRQDIKRGTKRFGGVPDSYVIAGGNLSDEATTAMVELARRMTLNITYDDSGTLLSFAPVIVKKERYLTPQNKPAYRYLPTLAAQTAQVARSIIWEPYTSVRSQNSRQYGRGI